MMAAPDTMDINKPAPPAQTDNREILLHGPEGIFLAFPELARIRQTALELDRQIRAEEKAASARQSGGDADV